MAIVASNTRSGSYRKKHTYLLFILLLRGYIKYENWKGKNMCSSVIWAKNESMKHAY